MSQKQINAWWAGHKLGSESVSETHLSETIVKWQQKIDSHEITLTSGGVQIKPTGLCIDILSEGKLCFRCDLKPRQYRSSPTNTNNTKEVRYAERVSKYSPWRSSVSFNRDYLFCFFRIFPLAKELVVGHNSRDLDGIDVWNGPFGPLSPASSRPTKRQPNRMATVIYNNGSWGTNKRCVSATRKPHPSTKKSRPPTKESQTVIAPFWL